MAEQKSNGTTRRYRPAGGSGSLLLLILILWKQLKAKTAQKTPQNPLSPQTYPIYRENPQKTPFTTKNKQDTIGVNIII